MKCTNRLFVAVILLVLVSCKKQPVAANENSIPNYIPVSKEQSFDMDGQILTCTLDTVIQDSRCPIKATCVWEGAAVARFKIKLDNTYSSITLATTRFGEYDSSTVMAGFKIEFINLAPHPELDEPINYNDYVAEVKITKL
jgi:hypothetical protein